jgi:hypothetical protein
MKVGEKKRKKEKDKKIKESHYILGYLLELIIKNLAIWNFLKFKNLMNLGHFFL